MRGRLRTGVITTAALVAAVVVYVGATLPRASLHLNAPRPATHAIGAYHIHTTRSDGSGTIPEIAAAARRAGLAFIVLTDHGDATREPDPPAYVDGVLVIDAVEINTQDGHVVALGLETAAPYPLAGLGRDVIDDIHRLGGSAIVAHPDSPRPSLRWRGMNQQFDGIEWINADSEWRDDSTWRLVGAAVRSIVRPAESIGSLFSRPARSLVRWDTAARARPVFSLAALDAHARIGWSDDDEPRGGRGLARPSYETLFRTVATTAILETPLTGEPRADAARVLAAMRAGRSYSIVRSLADPASLSFTAARASGIALMGSRLSAGEPATLTATVDGAPGARLVLFRSGQRIESGLGRVSAPDLTTPGVYRVEVLLPASAVPWIVSNAIVIEPLVAPTPAAPPTPSSAPREVIALPIGGPRWAIESDPVSKAALVGDADRIGLTFALSSRPPHGQYAALVIGGHDTSGIDQVSFVGQASRPLRVSVQVRLPGGRDGQRWAQSVYLDETPRAVTLRMPDFEPVGLVTSRRPNVAPVQSLLFVVDTVNARPGSQGTMWVSQLSLRVDRLNGPPR